MRLASGCRPVVRERDAKRAALGGVERVDVTRHLIGHHPLLHSFGIEQCSVDARSRSADVARHMCRAHGGSLTSALGNHDPLGLGRLRLSKPLRPVDSPDQHDEREEHQLQRDADRDS